MSRPEDEPGTVLPGTLDLLVLKAVSLGEMHGYGVLLRITQITRGALIVEQGALYPALHRLEHQGLLSSDWGVSENKRKAKFYRLTVPGRRRLQDETASWSKTVSAIAAALAAEPEVA
jgi:PadR family transcriptional regulator PadR